MIKLLCVGLGGMGLTDRKAAEASGEFEVAGGVDIDGGIRAEFTRETRKPAFGALEEALKKIKADAALISCPDKFHAPFSIAAIRAGLDVICEKPMAESIEQAARMLDASLKHKRMLMVNHQLRWAACHYQAARMIKEGAIGEIQSIEFDMHVFSDVCMKGYRAGVGQLILNDLGIHHFDLIRYLSGKTAEKVYMRSWASNELDLSIKTATGAHGIIQMDGPVTVSYRSGMRAVAKQTGYTCRVCAAGSLGVLVVEQDELTLQSYKNHMEGGKPDTIKPKPPPVSSMQAYARSIKTREPSLTDGTDNIKSLEVLFASIESVETGNTVCINKKTP